MGVSDSVAGALILMAAALIMGGSGLGWLLAKRAGRGAPRRARREVRVEMTCTVCQRPLVFDSSAVAVLTPAETALVVRVRPNLVGRRMGEYTCPYCEAAHCFTTDRARLEWVGVNLYQPQARTVHCFECRRILQRPPGRPGTRLAEMPNPLPDYGLECPHCHAVCCVGCCRDYTRKRTKDGSLLCPRCSRGPVESLYYLDVQPSPTKL